MTKFELLSERGDILPLSGNKFFTLTNIDGQTSAEADVAAATNGTDGDTINNMQTIARIIVIDLRINSDVTVEEAKREILRVVKYKKKCGVRWTQEGRETIIYGKVEKIDMPRWVQGVTMQIFLHCEQPFWEDIDDVVQQINEAINLHYFTNEPNGMLFFPEEGIPLGEYDTERTKSFFNAGDVSCGLEITLLAHETVTNPIIYDGQENYFGLGYAENPFVMQVGDYVVISTHRGRKNVLHNGVNVFDKIKPNSTWLQLETGDNVFAVDSDDESTSNMSFSLIYKQRYI